MEVDIIVSILAVVAGIIGIVGSIVPGIPGPPIGWCGMLILYIWGNGICFGKEPISTFSMIIWALVMIAVTVLDFIVPSWITKKTGGSKCASRGALIGLFAGMICTPIGMILGAFLGALIGELAVAKKSAGPAFKAAFGAFLGIMLGTGMKLIVTVWIMLIIIAHL